MKPNLEPAKSILRSFLKEIEKVKDLQKNISEPIQATSFSVKDRLPEFNHTEFVPAPDAYWTIDDAYMWNYAEAWHPRTLMHRPKKNPMPDCYHKPAKSFYDGWIDQEADVTIRGCKFIPPPADRSLIDYLKTISSIITEKNEDRNVWVDSVASFTGYLRKLIPLIDQGELEGIFPREREIRPGYTHKHTEKGVVKVKVSYILRRAKNDAVYAIDVLAFSEIIQNLVQTAIGGRPQAHHLALETLGFALLCHAVGSARGVIEENILFTASLTGLTSPDPQAPIEYFQPSYFIAIQTHFGIVNIPISKTLHDFLVALPRDPNSKGIFTKPIENLYRTLKRAVAKSKRCQRLGHITFGTFLTPLDLAIGQRFSPKKNSSKLKKLKNVIV